MWKSVALILYIAVPIVTGSEVVVSTGSGDIRGYVLDLSSRNSVGSDVDSVNMFLGIPYAEPPIGDLRFALPVEKRPWAPDVFDAMSFSPACPQHSWFLRTYSFPANYSNYDEDCLYLNIYVPQVSPERKYFSSNKNGAGVAISVDPNATFPVLFWVHGGAYRYGSGAEYDGRILSQEGVIVVTINYRLGILGFLSTDDDIASGNYGLLDQLTALKWVKDNIASFHGDPDRITIFGQSAGGGSVSLHMFSKLANGLFNSVIPQSGCALSPWAIYRPPHQPSTYAKALADKWNCPTNTSHDLITCLRHVNSLDLATTSVKGPPMIATFAPRVDGYYITDLPEVLLQQGDYIRHVNVMTGFVPQELSEDLSGEPGIENGLTSDRLMSLFREKAIRYLDNADNIYNAMACAYPPSGDVQRNREYAINMNSDYGYVVPHTRLAEEMSNGGEHIWLYDFTYRSPDTLKQEWIGVPHAEELYYQFGAPFLDDCPCPGSRDVTCPVTWGDYQIWSRKDMRVSFATMRLWADFARLHHNSKQFLSTSIDVQSWPDFSQGRSLLNISSNILPTHLEQTPGQKFWDSYNYLNLLEPVPHMCDKNTSTSIIG